MGIEDNDEAFEAEPVLAVRRSARRAKLRDKFTNIPSEDSNSAGSRRSKRLREIAQQTSPQVWYGIVHKIPSEVFVFWKLKETCHAFSLEQHSYLYLYSRRGCSRDTHVYSV